MNLDLILQKAAKIKLLICDVDGVLTDGHLYLGDTSEILKTFHIHDGLGIKLVQQTGIVVAIITSRESPIVYQRMQSLGVQHIYQHQIDKMPAYENLLSTLQLTDEQVAYVGDDLPDLPLIQRAGLGIAVANANAFVSHHATWQTRTPGGHGAVREICELLMQAQNTLSTIQQRYLYHAN